MAKLSAPRADRQSGELAWMSRQFKHQVVIDKQFKSVGDLTGYVVHLASQPEKQSIIYTDRLHRYVIMGSIIDRKQGNVTAQDATRYLNNAQDQRVVKALSHLHGILQGHLHSPRLTLVIDPNSHWFPVIYKNLETDVGEGLFSINWVLVNYLKPNGPDVANDILRSSHPLMALAFNAKHYDILTQTGGYVKNRRMTSKIRAILRSHWDTLQVYSLYALPISVFQAGGKAHVIHGLITDELLENYFHPS